MHDDSKRNLSSEEKKKPAEESRREQREVHREEAMRTYYAIKQVERDAAKTILAFLCKWCHSTE
jgi:hypothetical protein